MSLEAVLHNIDEAGKVFDAIKRKGWTRPLLERLTELDREFDKLVPLTRESLEKVRVQDEF